MNEVDNVVRLLDSNRPLTVDELRRAAEILGRGAPAGQMAVLATKVRIAFRLEKLGA